jgi:hypothetical protein
MVTTFVDAYRSLIQFNGPQTRSLCPNNDLGAPFRDSDSKRAQDLDCNYNPPAQRVEDMSLGALNGLEDAGVEG